MIDILNSIVNPSNQTFIAVIVFLCGIRVFIEMTKLNPVNWPISKKWAKAVGTEHVEKFHQMGLYICVAQILLWGPELLFSAS